MATLQMLTDDVCGWLNRQDVVSRMPGWVAMVETEIAQTLRARCMVKSGIQSIDAAYISLPVDFATMESIHDVVTGESLELKDQWTGDIRAPYTSAWRDGAFVTTSMPCTGYRLVHDCVEFLPHPWLPDPPDPNWRPQSVLMGWYAKPKPLLLPSDTNTVLDNLYAVYLWGCIQQGALFELDDDRAAQADAKWQMAITRANTHKQQSDYSGAPFRSELATVF